MKKVRFVTKRLFFMLFAILTACICSFAASAEVTEESLSDTHFRIDWEPTAGSFWDSTSSHKLSTNDTAFNNQYIASGFRFTKDTLPVGSYIFIDSGYRYRPEGWIDENTVNASSARPENVSTACVEVTEEWWGDWTIRAFHIQNNESSKKYTVEGDTSTYTYNIRANFDEAKDKLRIYVPNGTTGVNAYVKLVKLNLDLTLGFYSSSGTSYKINTTATNSNQFLATQIFTKETLPVGSVIEVDSGYQYRPEGWTELGVATAVRPGNVSTTKVEVTEEWWGDFNYRAFNISAKPQTDISAVQDEVASHFRIYVPETAAPPVFEWTLGYWDSTSHAKISTGSELAKRFAASQMFTKETLPIGSVIEIDSGYKYRPDGWIDLETTNAGSARPGNVTTASITVTEEWWGDYTYRAFNVSTSDQADISSNYLEAASHFNITLPNGTKIMHPESTSAGGGSEEEEETPEVTVEIPEAEEGVVRVLAIGNSYSNDAMHYAASIADGLGIKAEFYNLYYGGCTIGTHYNFYNNNSAEYTFYRNNAKYVADKVTMKSVLEAAQFDYITFQQGSWSSDQYSTYSNLDELMAIVREYQPNAEFMIHQTWGYCSARSCNGDDKNASGKGYESSAAMFAAVEACYKQAAADNGNLRIIKSGRAVETAKTEYGYTDDYGNSTSIYSDFNSHLANVGDYLAGCVWIETIFGTDVRNTTFTNSFADADTLQEIAHTAVGNVYTAKVTVSESSDFGVPVIKTAAADGFDYDGRARIIVLKGSETVDTVYQNADGTMPEMNLAEGTYKFRIEKNGYLAHTTEELAVVAGEEYVIPEFTLIGGDIKDDAGFCGDGVIDIDDFTRVLRGFNINSKEIIRTAADINCDGAVNVADLAIVKAGFSETAS